MVSAWLVIMCMIFLRERSLILQMAKPSLEDGNTKKPLIDQALAAKVKALSGTVVEGTAGPQQPEGRHHGTRLAHLTGGVAQDSGDVPRQVTRQGAHAVGEDSDDEFHVQFHGANMTRRTHALEDDSDDEHEAGVSQV
jgi:hypothetical protein